MNNPTIKHLYYSDSQAIQKQSHVFYCHEFYSLLIATSITPNLPHFFTKLKEFISCDHEEP